MTSSLRPAARNAGTYKWAVVAMLWFVCFLNYADRQAIFSVFPLIKEELHLTEVQLGVVASAFMWMYALFGPFAGWLCDRLPRKTVILGALVFWSLITAATAMAHTYARLILCRALGGLGEAFYFPAAMSLVGDYHGLATRSRAMSLHQSAVYAGSIAGGAVSGWIGQDYGWRASFTLFGALGVGLGLLLWGLLREPVRGMSEEAVVQPDSHAGGNILLGLREIFQNRMVLVLVAAFIGANFVAVVFLTWMPTFLNQKFHMSLAMAGFSATAYLQIASVAGVLSGGFLADNLRRKTPGGRILAQSIGLLCGVPFLFLTGSTVRIPVLIASMVGFGYFKGIYDANIWAGLYEVVPVQRRGAAAGMMNSLGWLGGGFASVLIAITATRFGFGACISATALIYLAIGILMFFASRNASIKKQ